MARLLIIAHAPLASAFKAVALHAYPELARTVFAVDVESGMGIDEVERQARSLLAQAPADEAGPPATNGVAVAPGPRSVTHQAVRQLARSGGLPAQQAQQSVQQAQQQQARQAPAVRAPADAAESDTSGELLILTDVFGASPANAAQRLADNPSVRILCGLNVPMLWRALNYARLPLAELAERSVNGAAQGLMSVASTRPHNQGSASAGDDAKHHHDQ